jgi:integrase
VARKRTGVVEPAGTWPDRRTRFRGRVRLADGTKSERFDVPQGMNEKQAKAWVAGIQAAEDVEHGLLRAKEERARKRARDAGEAHPGESADAWFKRYLPTLECGESHRRITGHNWTKWIAPTLGTKPMHALTRDDVEDVRDALDRALAAKTIRPGTARNVWSTLTGALKAAYAARDRSLRVHASPLHFGILPPRGGASRQRPWLYPSEWRALMTCAPVPLEWRQLYSLALYSGLRPNELRALVWKDVDLVAHQIHVSKAWDGEKKIAKAPKTAAGQRTVPIEPALLPLLEALKGEHDELVAPLLSRGEDRNAEILRAHLVKARVTRPRLTADTETEEPMDFRSLRDSYATWLALAGVPDKRIQRRLGHASNTTTDRYIKAAEAFDVAAIGEPFPPLPPDLLAQPLAQPSPTKRRRPGIPGRPSVARVGLKRPAFAKLRGNAA